MKLLFAPALLHGLGWRHDEFTLPQIILNVSRIALLVITLLAAALYIAGILLPLFTLNKFYIFENQVSLLSGIQQLWQNQDYLVFALLSLFCLVLPLLKVCLALLVVIVGHRSAWVRRLVGWVHVIGRWSMLDVFVVALLLVSIKLSAVATMTIHSGYYVFALAVLFIMVLSTLLKRYINKPQSEFPAE